MWVKGEIFRNLADAEGAARGLDRDGQASLFDRMEWFRRTLEHCPPGGAPLIARARAEGSDAWLFLVEDGGRAKALASWYTLAFRPVFTGGPADGVKAALLVAIARRLKKRLAAIDLAPIPTRECELLTRAFRRAGWAAFAHERTGNWTADVGGLSFADYWAARPGEVRSTWKRKGTKAGMEIAIHDRFDADAWADYESVYAESWKPEEGSSDFLRAMAEDEGAAGALRLGVGRIEGAAVAAQLWTVEHGRAVIHKLAHRDGAREHSPGTLLSHAMFERAIDQDHVDVIDFGTGDDGYKRDWMDARAPLFALSLYNPRRLAGLAGAGRAWASALVGRGRRR